MAGVDFQRLFVCHHFRLVPAFPDSLSVFLPETRPVGREVNLCVPVSAGFGELLGFAVGLAEDDEGVHVRQALDCLVLL